MSSVRQDIHQLMSGGYDVRVAGVPGHVGVIGNDEVDALARLAKARPNVDIHLIKHYLIVITLSKNLY